MGPDALRVRSCGRRPSLGQGSHDHTATSARRRREVQNAGNPMVHGLAETRRWTRVLAEAARDAAPRGLPIFLAVIMPFPSASLPGMAAHAPCSVDRSSCSGSTLCGFPHRRFTDRGGQFCTDAVAYSRGPARGFEAFRRSVRPVPLGHLASVALALGGPPERAALEETEAQLCRHAPHRRRRNCPRRLRAFLERVAAAEGLRIVSLDVDFPAPSHRAPARGNEAVPRVATFREALWYAGAPHDSGLVLASLDLVELIPSSTTAVRTALR